MTMRVLGRSWVVAAIGLLGAAVFGFWLGRGPQAAIAAPPPANPPAAAAPAAPSEYSQRVVAYIYGSIPITREDLGEYLIARHGLQGFDLGTVNDPTRPLIYVDPGTGAPIDSVRWEMFRQGMQDYQMLAMLRLAVDDASGRKEQDPPTLVAIERAQKLFEQIPDLAHDARDFDWDASRLRKTHDLAGELLSILSTH